MTTIIGIFDSSPAVENAVSKLNERGLAQEVFDPNLELAEMDSGGEPALLADDVGGLLQSAFDTGGDEYDGGHFRASLSDLRVPDEAIQYYETLFERGEIFVVVETDEHAVDKVMDLMRATGASLVGRHC